METFKLLRDLANAGAKVSVSQDWGGNSLTVDVETREAIWPYRDTNGETKYETGTHTHVGTSDMDDERARRQLNQALQGFLDTVLDAKPKTEYAGKVTRRPKC